ncbi:MAG: hypothetical protein SGPRY_010305, partial [Prymnesium sp.]
MKRIFKRGPLEPVYWHAIDDSNQQGEEGPYHFKSNRAHLFESLSEAAEGLLASEPLLGEDEQVKEHKFWWPLMRPPEARRRGRSWGYDRKSPPMLLVSVQLVPEQKFEEFPCGHGRWASREWTA